MIRMTKETNQFTEIAYCWLHGIGFQIMGAQCNHSYSHFVFSC